MVLKTRFQIGLCCLNPCIFIAVAHFAYQAWHRHPNPVKIQMLNGKDEPFHKWIIHRIEKLVTDSNLDKITLRAIIIGLILVAVNAYWVGIASENLQFVKHQIPSEASSCQPSIAQRILAEQRVKDKGLRICEALCWPIDSYEASVSLCFGYSPRLL